MEDETIEQRRQRNIQNNFLKLIELGLQPIVREEVKPKTDDAKLIEVDVFRDYFERIDEKNELFLKKYPPRVYQVKQLCGYSLSCIYRSPVLVCEGPSGSGKSELVRSVIQDLPFPSACVSCLGYNSAPRFLGMVWFSIKSCLKSYCQFILQRHADVNQKLFDPVLSFIADDSVKIPAKMVQLVNQLKDLLNSFFGCIDECSSGQCFFYLILDRLDEVSNFLEDGAAKLLQLSTLCHPRIKVIASLRDASLIRDCDVPYYHLSFPPYTPDEVGSIVRCKLRDCIEKAVNAELKNSKSQSSSSGSSKSNSSSSGSAVATVAVCCDVLLPKMDMLIKTASPFVGRIAFNVTTLWDFLLQLWNNLYHVTLDKIVQEIVQAQAGSNSSSNSSGDVVTGLLSSVGLKEIKSAVQSLMSQAYWDVSCSSGAGRSSGGDAAVKTVSVAAINNNWGKYQNWCSQIPKRQVFLMIAAFLASNNPKESDVQKLTDERSGRRKKARVGTDDAAANAANGGAVGGAGGGELGGSLKTGKGLQFRSISLERLVSVFLVVAGTSFKDGLTPRGYGNVEFYSMITSLVSMKYLTPLPSWNVKNPHYISHITYDMAQELSSRVSFNLAAYMVGSDTNCPL